MYVLIQPSFLYNNKGWLEELQPETTWESETYIFSYRK